MDQQRVILSRLRSGLVLGCGLVVLVLLSYLPALGGGFVFDDHAYVTGDARLTTAGGLGRIWTEIDGGGEAGYRHQYYPLTSTVLWVQHQLWGFRPFGYHVFNVLLHAVNALLLWRLLRVLAVPGAWLAAAVFAVHPVHVQSVAWVSELKNVLSGMFFLGSALVLVRWHGLTDATKPPRGLRTYAWGLALFIAALLSKTATCLLPAALMLVVWWKRGRVTRRDLLGLCPLVVLGVVFVGMTVYLESLYGGAQGEVFRQTALERVLIAGRAMWFYAGKLLWPAALVFIYPRWTIDIAAWWQHLFPLAAVVVGIGLWTLRHRIGRGPIAAFGCFVMALVPMYFVNVSFMRLSYVANHWVYWASMGFIGVVVAGVVVAWRRCGETPSARWVGPSARWAGPVAAVLVIGSLSSLTWQRARVYESPITLWTTTLAANPDAWVAHNNLAIALARQGRPDMRALELRPGWADAHNNLGDALQSAGQPVAAIGQFRRAIEIDPRFAEARYNLANALRGQGRPDESELAYHEALRLNPRYTSAHNNLGTLLLEQGRLDEAAERFETVIRIDPQNAGAHHNLRLVRSKQGRHLEAHAR
jgi:tetratricopeptide (TPR) repeat protein